MSSSPFITVVVPTFNEESFISRTLDRLLDTDFPSECLEIIVADGGSTDRTVALARSVRNVRVIHNPGRLQSIGVNKAVAEADPRSEWIIRCDCHSEYPANFVGKVMGVIEGLSPEYAAVFFSRICDIEPANCFRSATGWAYLSKFGGGTPHRTTGYSGSVEHGWHGAFRKSAFLAVGGYDEQMATVEDVDLSLRLRKAGYGAWNDARLDVRYFARDRITSLWKQFRGYGRGRIDLWKRHPGVVKPRHLAMILIGPWTLLTLAMAPFAPWFLLALLPYGVLLLAIALRATFQNRSSCMLCLPVVLATMHYSWCYGFIEQLIKSEPFAVAKGKGRTSLTSRLSSIGSASSPGPGEQSL
jgi:succinoglycan biosynthesis protein ExoA